MSISVLLWRIKTLLFGLITDCLQIIEVWIVDLNRHFDIILILLPRLYSVSEQPQNKNDNASYNGCSSQQNQNSIELLDGLWCIVDGAAIFWRKEIHTWNHSLVFVSIWHSNNLIIVRAVILTRVKRVLVDVAFEFVRAARL